MADWNDPATAPKDRPILVDCGWPWAVVAVWNTYMERWVTAQLEGNLCEGKDDPAWITDHENDLKGWMELPEVKRG
ncbi:hypothetical protein [Pseudomonas sp. TMP25]|uniref:hypothetical protein n=1 Tax=Pseudomonas sp. TMP25 TaxID=3136561 RepID=UPI003100F8A4